LYQGKELQEELGLGTFDFEWRMYDPAIGRTFQPDPHADFYFDLSPYSWVANNPINVIDPTGMDTVKVNNLNMDEFDMENDVVMLDEVAVVAGDSDEPADATQEYIQIWMLRQGDKVMGHRDGISGLEDIFGHRTYGPYDVDAEGRIMGLSPTIGMPNEWLSPGGSVKGGANLIKAATAPSKGGLTAVGRALQKHGSRPGSLFPKVTGNTASINAQGETMLKTIINNPSVTTVTRHHARFGNIMEIKVPNGQGARFSADGKTFYGFIE
jgi:RHS repeat-associated protein